MDTTHGREGGGGKGGSECVLITGSSGLVGFLLAGRLAGAGYKVVGLDPAPVPDVGAPLPFTAVRGDAGEPHFLHGLFQEHGVQAVVHCGGISGPSLMKDDPFGVTHINVLATAHLLEASRRFSVSRFVYCSSIGAYGETPAAHPEGESVSEDAPFRPMEVYGASKAAADVLCRGYRMQYGLETVSMRIGRVYGAERRTENLIGRILDLVLAGRPARLGPAGTRQEHYVYVEDVVSGLHAALEAPSLPRAAYNLAGPETADDRKVAAVLQDLLPEAEITFAEGACGPASRPYRRDPLDMTATQQDLGFTPAYPLRRGLAEQIARLRAAARVTRRPK